LAGSGVTALVSFLQAKKEVITRKKIKNRMYRQKISRKDFLTGYDLNKIELPAWILFHAWI
jgi:hypothetical protein